MDRQVVREVARLLDRLVKAQRMSHEDAEVIHEEVMAEAEALPREAIVEALDAAVGKNVRRRKVSVYLLACFSKETAVQERIGESLADPDPEWRRWLVQTIGNGGLVQFAPALNRLILEDADLFTRQYAVLAAAKLRQEVNLTALLQLVEDHDENLRSNLLWACKEFAREECRPFLQAVFENPGVGEAGRIRVEWGLEKADRVLAAWGLGKLGDAAAIEYLTAMLDDPDVRLACGFRPGESLRAAQALCDIHGWPFQGSPTAAAEVRARLSHRSASP